MGYRVHVHKLGLFLAEVEFLQQVLHRVLLVHQPKLALTRQFLLETLVEGGREDERLTRLQRLGLRVFLDLVPVQPVQDLLGLLEVAFRQQPVSLIHHEEADGLELGHQLGARAQHLPETAWRAHHNVGLRELALLFLHRQAAGDGAHERRRR